MNTEDQKQINERLLAHMVALNARLDALTTVVEILAGREGVERRAFRETLETLRASAHQTYLEKVEDVSPGLSARIDQRGNMPDIDPDTLGWWRADGGTPP